MIAHRICGSLALVCRPVTQFAQSLKYQKFRVHDPLIARHKVVRTSKHGPLEVVDVGCICFTRIGLLLDVLQVTHHFDVSRILGFNQLISCINWWYT
jgi:hypothetical protein